MIKPKGRPGAKAQPSKGYVVPKEDNLWRGPGKPPPKRKPKITLTPLGGNKMARTSVQQRVKKGTVMYTTVYQAPPKSGSVSRKMNRRPPRGDIAT